MVEFCLSGYSSGISAVNITEQGNLLLTSSNDKALKIWEMSEPSYFKDQKTNNKPFVTVHTPDEKFKLTYLYGRLNEVVKKNSNKLDMGVRNVYDPFYQNILKFYNLIDNIKEGKYDTLLNTSSEVLFSKFLYTTLHIFANIGNSKALDQVLNLDTKIKKDYFGNSPIYYALVKKNRECADQFFNFVVLITEKGSIFQIQELFSVITNDIPSIIRSSLKSLPLLFNKCLISSNPIYTDQVKNLPICRFDSNFSPSKNDFLDSEMVGGETIPVIMRYTTFPLPSNIGSKKCIDLLEAINECSNKNIYNTNLIQYYLQIQWNQLVYWIFGYTLLLWLNLVILVILLSKKNINETWMLPVFILINFGLFSWETIQMFVGGLREYFKDTWNVIDFCRFSSTMAWVVMRILGYTNGLDHHVLTWFVVFLSFARGITGFRLFDGTRYYVRLILRALKDMGYFFIILGYSTLTFGVMLQISRHNETFEFKTLWMDSYSLNFGNFEAQENFTFSFETTAYLLATVVNVILMLNLLVSILGDSFDRFQSEKVLVDYSEKASIILEIQKMFFWVGSSAESSYLHVMCSSKDVIQDDSIDEKVDNLATSLGDFVQSQVETSKQLTNQIQVFENKFQKKLDGMTEVNENLHQSQGEKIKELSNHIEILENKFQGKFNDLNETLKTILEAIKPSEEKKE